MFKTRLGLFSVAFVIAVATAQSWPQLAAAQAPSGSAGIHDSVDPNQAYNLSQSNDDSRGTCSPGAGEECFRGFLNSPFGGATLTLDVGLDALVLSDLTLPNRSTEVAAACTVPSKGSTITLGSKAAKAGDNGFRITKKTTKIPDDVTSYFIELDEYWGISCTGTPWVTNPIPIGFRTSGGSITACANFNVAPINCTTVRVEFTHGTSTGVIECPSGSLFSVSDTQTMTLRKVVAHATCLNGNGSCAETVARDRAKLNFRFRPEVVGIVPDVGCSIISGTAPYSAKRMIIKPKLASCSESCSASDRATDDPLSRGGNTPPIRKIKILTAYDSSASNRSLAQGSLVILDEAIGDVPTVGTWGLVVMVQLVLVAGTVVFRRQLPIISTVGHGG